MIVLSVHIPVIFYIAVVAIAIALIVAVAVVSDVFVVFAVLLSLLMSFSLFVFVNILHLIFHELNFIFHKRFRELHANVSSKIFLNICVALGAALPVFLVTAERRKIFSDTHCIVAGILNHLLFLAALAWMVLEVYTMYFAFVKCLPKAALDAKIPRISICCLICWGE